MPFQVRRSFAAIATPRRATDLKQVLSTMENDHDINKQTSRHLIWKITKGFEEKEEGEFEPEFEVCQR